MSQQNTDMVNDLLPRYCEGTVSAEERTLVEDWINKSDENYQVAKQIHNIFLATDTINILEKINTEKALENVSSKMTVRRKTEWLTWIQRIAAVLLLPALITILIQQNRQPAVLQAQMIEVTTNPGMTTTLHLPDGTAVYLNSESSLQYPSRFEGETRLVKLEGEAFFSVTKNEKQRFIVSAPHDTKVEVLGTVFNVEAFVKDTTVSTTLLEGKVNFVYANNMQSETISLKPGQKLVYDSNTLQTRVYKTTGESETAWKDGKIVFLDTPFQQALRMLEKRYNVEFVVSSSKYAKDSFTGSFNNQRLERILEVFKASSNIKWRYIDTDKASNEKSRVEIY